MAGITSMHHHTECVICLGWFISWCVHLCAGTTQAADPLVMEFQGVRSHLPWVLGSKLHSLQNQQGLLTALQPFVSLFFSELIEWETGRHDLNGKKCSGPWNDQFPFGAW